MDALEQARINLKRSLEQTEGSSSTALRGLLAAQIAQIERMDVQNAHLAAIANALANAEGPDGAIKTYSIEEEF